MSRIFLNTRRRDTMRALTYPNVLHGAIESCFEEKNERKLWRIDHLNGRTFILIVSKTQGDFDGLIDQFGYRDARELGAETKSYDPFLATLQNGQTWQFRYKANPVIAAKKSEKKKSNERGKIKAHVSSEHQVSWLLERAQKMGVAFHEETVMPIESKWYDFRKGRTHHRVTFRAVTFEGVLDIKDADLLKDVLINGYGRQKAYGCGLMTLAPIGYCG